MKRWFIAMLLVLGPAAMPGQGIPLATLSGRVTSEDGAALSGVAVVAQSPNLQDRRQATTFSTGEFFLPFLPPGSYVVRFELPGMRTVERAITLLAAGSGRLDVAMQPASVEESVTVSADAGAGSPLETTQVLSNYRKALTDQLPITRSLRSVALLAPGVTDNGPTGSIGSANTRAALVISGAQSFESLFLVDGAVVNENLRGQPQDLFIEDAIQETTVLTGSVSSEYGRFTGGVVNVVTRSGGNQLHASFRTNFSSDGWRSLDPVEEGFSSDPRIDQVDETYEATLGGPVWTDRIWFFAAGRNQTLNDSRYIFFPEDPDLGDVGGISIPYAHTVAENRIEAKLTGNITPAHNLVAAYTDVRASETNADYLSPGELAVLDDTEAPHSILTLNYNGVLSSRLFVEAQYSRRKFAIEGGGSPYRDFVRGTRVDVDFRGGFTLNSPAGSESSPENYGNQAWLAKASYLLPTEKFGTHDLRAGYEWFNKDTLAEYHFSGSDFNVLGASAIFRDNQAFPVFDPNLLGLAWFPIQNPSLGDEFLTQSVFFNDRVAWGAHWTFNLGVRYDVNDSRNAGGRAVSQSRAWSPRLAAQYDPSANGKILLNAGYAKYVAGLHEGIVQLFADFGQPSTYAWFYGGPCVNCEKDAPTSTLLTTAQALAQVDAWFQGIGGTAYPADYVRIAGLNRIVPTDGLVSPSAREYSFGVGAALGNKGWVRADFLYRNYDNFYDDRIDRTTGQVEGPQGQPLDLEILTNSPILDRRYEAVQTRIDYRFTQQIFAGGSYTWSRLTGNVVGENAFVSAAPERVGAYPEYSRESWSYPTGYLPGDQRNRARIWVGGNLSTRFGSLGMTVLESYQSGLPYEAVGRVSFETPGENPQPYLPDQGYASAPTDGDYFFSKRGEFRTDNISSTDVALTLTVQAFHSLEIFVQPQVLNLFNQQGSVAVDTTVLTNLDDPDRYLPFDPFTEKPVRGVHYELARSTFGTPTAYQPPRTFRFSVGLRF